MNILKFKKEEKAKLQGGEKILKSRALLNVFERGSMKKNFQSPGPTVLDICRKLDRRPFQTMKALAQAVET